MSDPLERLANLVRSPIPAVAGQWPTYERQFGITFPRQYKNLIDEFAGPSSWWDDTLHVLSPIRGGRYALRKNVDNILKGDRESREGSPENYPLPLYPEAGGLFPWAVSDYATLYWITRCGPGFGPDQWPTLIRGLRSYEFEVHFDPVDQILYMIATGKLRSIVLPND